MATKGGSRKKTGQIRSSRNAGDKDRLITELQSRIAALEDELRLMHEDAASTGIDIVDRELVEVMLRESEEKFRVLAESSPAAISVFQGERVVYVNDAASSITGYSREERQNMKFWDIVHPDDQEIVKKRILARLKGEPGRPQKVYRVIRKGGEIRWVLSTAAKLNYDGKPAILVITIDVTDSKHAEEKLLESEEKFRVLAETMPVAICMYHGEKFIFVNEATESITGYARDELLNLKLWDMLPPGFREQLRMRWEERRRGKPVPSRYEVQFRTKSGELRWIDVSIGSISIRGVPAVLAAAIDITERKRTEEALTEAKQQAELYLDLMGHDINNMHQIALGYLELARGTCHEAGRDEALDKPIEVLQRCAQLIKNVRKLQKLKEGAFRSQEVDVCEVLVDVQREFGAVPHKAITLNMNGCDDCHVRANELLQDVFANLVGNAIKHTGDSADINIDLDLVKDNGVRYCRVMVEDDGPGIPDDFKGRVFNRMLKGTTKSKGMGLGLYLVKSLVESYNGRLWVEDRVLGNHTKGARFVVLLPATQTP